MNWNDAADDLLQQILSQTPRPVREEAEAQLRARDARRVLLVAKPFTGGRVAQALAQLLE